MASACPVLTPEQRTRSDIVAGAERVLTETVLAALKSADRTATIALRASGVDEVEPLEQYFTACLHQKLYCILCGADPETFVGGNATAARAIIRNGRQIAEHYWGAEADADGAPVRATPDAPAR